MMLFFKANFILISIKGDKTYTNVVPNIYPRSFDKSTGDLICTFSLESFSCQLIMNFNKTPLWTVKSDKAITVSLIKNDNHITKELEKIINDLPPTLIMPKGYIIEGRTKIKPNNLH